MTSMSRLSVSAAFAAFLAGCSDDAPSSSPPAASEGAAENDAAAGGGDHGDALALGDVTLGGIGFDVTKLGELHPGEEGAFSVTAPALPAAERAALGLYLWVEDEARQQVSSPAKGTAEGDGWHFHVTPRAGDGAPVRVVLRLRHDGVDERAGLPLDGHGHEHVATPHDGVLAAFSGPDGATAGHLELKLHDDKGDLELWLAEDAEMATPFDLPLDAEVTVTFIDHDDRAVTLAVRDEERNEDEDGNPNVRDGATNYFIFPGDTGADAIWLQGADFQSIVQVTFEADGARYTSEEFVLTPHTHAGGGH